nr:PREDICTED: ligand-dependent corepressor isoform X2 [Lepisosteus oculatus]
MASLCKRQQCTLERRGFRQELDSWRHKLIHCVGFESILEGLFGPGLVKDLTLFKDCEPEVVSDWSFDENCLFCCLRREKVKEHLVGLNDQVLEVGERALCNQEQSKINRLERQAEEFLNAVFYRKADIPRVSDPHIPLVAREIMQRMIRQFAAEYTSKNSSSQDPIQPNGTKDQSLPKAPALAPPPPPSPAAAAASAQNPVLSKLLMADQDSPLDLTVRKSELEPSDQDGVLDLSTKKSPGGSSASLNSSPGCSTAPLGKGDSGDMSRDEQTPSSLEQFMAKLCRHHQRQIVDALGFLQTEVKAAASSFPAPATAPKVASGALTETGCTQQNTGVPFTEQGTSFSSIGSITDSLEASGLKTTISVTEPASVVAGLKDKSDSICSSEVSASLNLPPSVSTSLKELKQLHCNRNERENVRHCGSQAGVKILPARASDTHVGTLGELQCNLTPVLRPEGDEENVEEFSPSLGKQGRCFDHLHHTEQKGSSGDTKDLWPRPSPNKRIAKTSSPVSAKTARKSRRPSCPRARESSVCQIVNDIDSQRDVVYISKPITECELESPKHVYSRGNARKSTRGHMYSEESWEVKTVRTLARKSDVSEQGNCPALMPESITLVTPKQVCAKPDSVPSLEVPFAGGCRENIGQKAPSKQLAVKEIDGDTYVEGGEADLIVEPSHTDLQQLKEKTSQPLKALLNLVRQQSKDPEQQLQSKVTKNPINQGAIPDDQPVEELPSSQQEEEKEQPEDISKSVVVASFHESKSEIISVEEGGHDCASESNSVTMSTVPVSAPNDFVNLEDNVITNEEGAQQKPVDLHSPDVPVDADKLHLEDITEGSFNKEIGKEQKMNKMSSACNSEDGDAVAEVDQVLTQEAGVEERGDDEATAGEATLVNDLELKPEEENSDGEKVSASTPESTSTKQRNDRDVGISDRCLRSRQHPGGSNIVLPKSKEETSTSLKVLGPQENQFKSPWSTRIRRSVEPKGQGPVNFSPNCSSRTLLESTAEPVSKPMSSEASCYDNKGEQSAVQTRQNYKSILDKERVKVGDPGGRSRTSASNRDKDKQSTVSSPGSGKIGVHFLNEVVELSPLNSEVVGENSSNPSSASIHVKSAKMPSGIESSDRRIVKPMTSADLIRHKKPVLRSPNLQSSSSLVSATKGKHEHKHMDCNIKTEVGKNMQGHGKDFDLFGLKNLDLSVEDPPKFLEALTEEENQGLITNLNAKYDKMQKGWVQMDKEGQPAPKPKNKADRLKEIWKSKRRIRRPRALDQQKFSPVQMLFMKTFNLANICRWFLQTTETKSLVIVKKINTRLPSETQLCFHNSNSVTSSSHGVYTSSQAERLKKHLKKFAVASPAKNNLKNQKLIAQAREHEGPCSKGKEKAKESTSATRITTKPCSNLAGRKTQAIKNQKATQNAKTPASARILRKYSNIREKLQVQQHKRKTKEATGGNLKRSCVNPLLSPKFASKPKLKELGKGTSVPGKNNAREKSGSKTNKAGSLPVSKREAGKKAAGERGARSSSGNRSSALSSKIVQESKTLKKKAPQPPPVSQKSQKTANVAKVKNKVEADSEGKKKLKSQGAQKPGVLKGTPASTSGTKVQKKPLKSRVPESSLSQQHRASLVPPSSQDQVLTRSQKKMESVGPKFSRKRGLDLQPPPAKRTRASVLK